jgi:hypothetical protein
VKESAVLGAAASFLLGALKANWQAEMNGQTSPVDLLLKGQPRLAQGEDLALREAYRTVVDLQQRNASRLLGPVLNREKDPYFVKVSIPAHWQRGGLSLDPSYVLRDRRDTALLLLRDMHDFVSERGSVHVPSHALIFQTYRNVCGGIFHFLIPSFNVTRVGQRFSGAHSWFRFSLEGARKIVNGHVWICPKDD